MKNKIIFYEPTLDRQTSAEERKVLEAMATGLSDVYGETIEWSDYQSGSPASVAVMFSWGKLSHREVLKRQALVHGKTLVINFGSLKRSDGYYTVGWNGLNGRAEYLNYASPPDRWERLGIKLKPWKSDGRNIIVTGQVPSDGSVAQIDILQWCEEQVLNLRCLTDRPIIFRPHPLARDISPNMPGATRSEKSFEEDLKDAWAVVTYNSTSSSMAVIDGVPIFTADRGSMAWEVSRHELKSIDHPLRCDRVQWAYNLAYTQWTVGEIRSGFAWGHLKDFCHD